MNILGNRIKFHLKTFCTMRLQGADSTVYGFVYEDIQYFYVKNAQGDVLQIRSKWGTTLVEYEYDAWGNCSIVYTHSAYGSFGEINPIRYRSYFYDFETGFYYLQSRYYDPQIRRFISVDNYISTIQGFIGYNIYVYCLNNPVMRIDESGYVSYIFMDPSSDILREESATSMGGHVGGGFGSGIYYDSSAYGTYAIRSITATYDANLGGYYYSGPSSAVINPNYYIVPNAQTVGDIVEDEWWMHISTGRSTPNNLYEQMAMEAVKRNPTLGKVIIPSLNDSRLPPGTEKMQQVIRSSYGVIIPVHYDYTSAYGVYFDFKFK